MPNSFLLVTSRNPSCHFPLTRAVYFLAILARFCCVLLVYQTIQNLPMGSGLVPVQVLCLEATLGRCLRESCPCVLPELFAQLKGMA